MHREDYRAENHGSHNEKATQTGHSTIIQLDESPGFVHTEPNKWVLPEEALHQ